MSPLTRVFVCVLVFPTAIAATIVAFMCVRFNVPWSNVHWWLFGFLWMFFAAIVEKAATQFEVLHYLNRRDKQK